MEIRPRGAEIIILHLSPITYETQESVMSVTRVALEEPAGNVIYYLTTLPELLNSRVAVFGDVFKKTRDATDACLASNLRV